MEYNFRIDVTCWQISKSIKVVLKLFSDTLTVSEIFSFQIIDLHKVGNGRRVSLLTFKK